MNQNKNNTVVAKTAAPHGVMVRREERTFAGPIPHPEILAQYDQIVPGAGERILRMAEKQSDHRQDIERQVIQSDIANSRRGQILGFLLALTCVMASMYIVRIGHPYVGSGISFASIAGLLGVYMHGSKSRNKERAEKTEALKVAR